MPRFISHSSRRLIAALAMATTLALPALTIIGGQVPASTGVLKVTPMGNRMH